MPRTTPARIGLATALVSGLTAGLLATSSTTTSAAPSRRAPQPSHFTVSSFNVLGANHTPPGGRRASGATRIAWVNQLLNHHHVDVAGFQELQPSQYTRLRAITKGSWGFYPGLGGQRKIDSENSIGWRTDKFRLVHGTLVNIPYFDGRPRAMPLVLLRDQRTGMLLYVANYHNPADTRKHPHQGRWRRAAMRIEIALQNQIMGHGIPRIMTGDMNERAEFFCHVTARTPLKAARPTSIRRNGVCQAGRPRSVDWILGNLRVDFSNYKEDRGPLVDRTTDHPMIVSDVTVSPSRMPRAWRYSPPPPVRPRVSR
ncbi:MAG TPA: endonuclease/exonuclease/phosphatase family protein [Nocardioidaceae bacterium]|nr:endonuclease/exonuclease/phosphatase family protein [Nocardioidaceae bacterium]